MPVLTILIGIPASGKTTVAREITEAREAILISSDDALREMKADLSSQDRNQAIYNAVKEKLAIAVETGRSVVIDSNNRAPKYRRPLLELARKCGYETEAVFCNTPLEQAIERNRTREAPASEAMIRQYERMMQIPTYAEDFDRIEVRMSEAVDQEAAAFFQEHEQRLIHEPVHLIRELEQDGRLERWIPELHQTIPVDQHNPHHRFTVYEHILKATESVAHSSLKMVWTLLLHDIGKAYPGIKQFTGLMNDSFGPFRKKEKVLIENGADIRDGRDTGDVYVVRGTKIPKEHITTNLNGHFYEHENLGAQLSYRVLTRLGYEHDFAYEVAALIQFHMLMPRGIEAVDVNQIHKFYARVGRYAADLMMLRMADSRGK